MQYDGELHLPRHFLVPPPFIERASEQYIVGTGLRVFACSESQKIGGRWRAFATGGAYGWRVQDWGWDRRRCSTLCSLAAPAQPAPLSLN